MEREELIKKILAVIEAGKAGFVFSTVDEEKRPQSRLLGALMMEGNFVVYLETSSDSRKMKQIAKNQRAQLLFFRPGYSEVVTLSGKATIEKSLKTKKIIWDKIPSCRDYYASYDAPDFGVIKFSTEKIEYLNLKLQLNPFELKLRR